MMIHLPIPEPAGVPVPPTPGTTLRATPFTDPMVNKIQEIVNRLSSLFYWHTIILGIRVS